jgi:hypothetical protein
MSPVAISPTRALLDETWPKSPPPTHPFEFYHQPMRPLRGAGQRNLRTLSLRLDFGLGKKVLLACDQMRQVRPATVARRRGQTHGALSREIFQKSP